MFLYNNHFNQQNPQYNLGNFQFAPNQSSQTHSQFNLGNYQFQQPTFDTSLNMPSFTTTTFSMPNLGASSGLAATTPSNSVSFSFAVPPMLFSSNHISNHLSNNHSNHHSSEQNSGLSLDAMIDLSGHGAKNLGLPAAPGLESLSLGINAAETAERLVHGVTQDIESGTDPTQAWVCNSLSSISQGATEMFLNTTIATATTGGMLATSTVAATGVLTANPAQFTAGLLGGVAIANLVVPAFNGAKDVSQTIGYGVNSQCNNAFDQARLLSRGGF